MERQSHSFILLLNTLEKISRTLGKSNVPLDRTNDSM